MGQLNALGQFQTYSPQEEVPKEARKVQGDSRQRIAWGRQRLEALGAVFPAKHSTFAPRSQDMGSVYTKNPQNPANLSEKLIYWVKDS
jgi:hypothetical protein